MPFTYDEIKDLRAEDVPFSYTDTQMLLYNLSVGMGRDPYDENELPYVFEKPALKVVPTAAAVLGSGGANLLQGVDINWVMLLHGEQRLVCHRPIPAAAELLGTTYIAEVVDKGPEKGAIVTLGMDVKLTSGEPLYSMENVIFMRGNGGCGGAETSSKTPHKVPDREPDLVHISETRPDQALLYRLNGDRNPLHADPGFAAKAGFPKPILHGLGSYGIACRAILASVCDYDPARIGSFDVRFTSPVFPGEEIHTDIWIDDDVASFRCRVPARDIVSINNGRCELKPASA